MTQPASCWRRACGTSSCVEVRAAGAATVLIRDSKTGRILTFSAADHAFFNDTSARFDAPAAAEAYRRLLDWLDRFVAKGESRERRNDDDDD